MTRYIVALLVFSFGVGPIVRPSIAEDEPAGSMGHFDETQMPEAASQEADTWLGSQFKALFTWLADQLDGMVGWVFGGIRKAFCWVIETLVGWVRPILEWVIDNVPDPNDTFIVDWIQFLEIVAFVNYFVALDIIALFIITVLLPFDLTIIIVRIIVKVVRG